MRYVLPKSLTWWAGLAAILFGLAALALPEHGPQPRSIVFVVWGAGEASPR